MGKTKSSLDKKRKPQKKQRIKPLPINGQYHTRRYAGRLLRILLPRYEQPQIGVSYSSSKSTGTTLYSPRTAQQSGKTMRRKKKRIEIVLPEPELKHLTYVRKTTERQGSIASESEPPPYSLRDLHPCYEHTILVYTSKT